MHSTLWMARTPFPFHIGFAPNAQAWEATLKKYGVPPHHREYPTTDARCTFFERNSGDNSFCLVTTNPPEDVDPSTIEGLLVHEAVHVFQFICGSIGEDRPSSEFEAYMIQDIYLFLSKAFKETRDGISKKPVQKARSKAGA